MGIGHVLAGACISPVLAQAAGGAALMWWNPDGATPAGAGCWGAYQPKGAASFAASIIDITSQGNDAGDPGGAATPTWDAVNGWKFNGVGNYLTTTFVPAGDQSQSALVQFSNVVGLTTRFLFGQYDAANRQFRISPNEGGGTVYYANGGHLQVAPNLVAGNLGVSGNQGYRNGIADGGLLGAWGGAGVNAVYIGCRNFGGPGFYIQAYIQAMAIYDVALTAPQVLARATAMAAL